MQATSINTPAKVVTSKAINPYEYDDLLDAASMGDLDFAKRIVQSGFKINDSSDDGRVLRYATSSGSVEVVKYLLSQGAKINEQDIAGVSSLYIAIDRGYLEIAALLIEAGADPNARTGYIHDTTPLHSIVMLSHKATDEFQISRCKKMAELLIKAGASKEARNLGGKTALEMDMKKIIQKSDFYQDCWQPSK